MAVARRAERFGATISGYAAGFVPLPLAATAWLMYSASNSVQAGSTSIFWVLVAAVPAAIAAGPYNCYRSLLALGDPYAARTGKLCAVFGVLGLVLMLLPFGLLLYLGWIGLVADVALVALTVPALARQRVLSEVETARMAERARYGGSSTA
jgi:hypothetical protein